MSTFTFRLNIPAQKLLEYYKGRASNVSVTCTTGQRLQFPAEKLRRHATRDGVHGVFQLSANNQGRFTGLVRVS